jgi:hypothetical protein
VSDQVNVGDYSLEISGDEVVVRDESGAIVETVELDDVDGEFTLPDGQKVDLASIMADKEQRDLTSFGGGWQVRDRLLKRRSRRYRG